MNYPTRVGNAARGIRRALEQFVGGQRCLNRHIHTRHAPVIFANGGSTRFFATGPSSTEKQQANNAKYRDLQKNRNETTGSLLNTHLDRAGSKQAGAGRPGSDGVFYLGIRPGEYETPKNYKKWKELGVSGKGEFQCTLSRSYAHDSCFYTLLDSALCFLLMMLYK